MSRAAALMLLALPLAACDAGTNVKIDAKSDDGNTLVTTDGNGTMSIKAPGFEGAIKLPKIQIDAEDFDVNGLKLYPGSKISDFHLDAEDRIGERDKGKLAVVFESPAALATVQAWFQDNMAKRGFKVERKGEGFAGTTDEGDPLTLDLSADGESKTKGRMEIRN